MKKKHTKKEIKKYLMGLAMEEEIYTSSIQFNLLVPKRKKTRTNKIRNPQPDRRTVNLPAGAPYIKLINGEEHLCFMYNTKNMSYLTEENKRRTISGKHEFKVKFHIEHIDKNDLKNLSQEFKDANCVYPRANLPLENYGGKRWEYENECNEMAYKFVLINPKLLYGNKGLIQRSVDTYRNINKLSRSRRAIKEEIINPLKRKKQDFPTIKVSWSYRGLNKSCFLRVDIEGLEIDEIDSKFKEKYSVFTPFWDVGDFGKICEKSISADNELAVLIAYRNIDNTTFWSAVKSADKGTILKSAVMKYKNNEIDEPEVEEDGLKNCVERITDECGFEKENIQKFIE